MKWGVGSLFLSGRKGDEQNADKFFLCICFPGEVGGDAACWRGGGCWESLGTGGVRVLKVSISHGTAKSEQRNKVELPSSGREVAMV